MAREQWAGVRGQEGEVGSGHQHLRSSLCSVFVRKLCVEEVPAFALSSGVGLLSKTHAHRALSLFQETINMFERNIIDLVGLFVENVQSLYPFLRDLGREALLSPGAYPGRDIAPASSLTKAGKGSPSAQTRQDAHE